MPLRCDALCLKPSDIQTSGLGLGPGLGPGNRKSGYLDIWTSGLLGMDSGYEGLLAHMNYNDKV